MNNRVKPEFHDEDAGFRPRLESSNNQTLDMIEEVEVDKSDGIGRVDQPDIHESSNDEPIDIQI